jgi:hypothetical protein
MARPSIQSYVAPTHTNGHLPAPAVKFFHVMTVSDEAISHRAYHRFLARGCTHGFDKEDWEEANRELVAEAFGK